MGEDLRMLLLHRITILIVMVLTAIIMALTDGFAQNTGEGWFGAGLTIFVFTALAWFTYEKKPIATWMTVLVLLFKGSDLLYDCMVEVAGEMHSSFFVLILKGLAGIYLTWGALVIHRHRPTWRA